MKFFQPSDVFKFFESEPIGAASLAQVHRALLKDGREVAVKVQHPSVKEHSDIDMKGMEVSQRHQYKSILLILAMFSLIY